MKHALDILITDEEQKEKHKVLGVFISNFETYTRHFGIADEKQKKVLCVLNGSLVGGGNSLFNLVKGGNLKKKFRKLWFKATSFARFLMPPVNDRCICNTKFYKQNTCILTTK